MNMLFVIVGVLAALAGLGMLIAALRGRPGTSRKSTGLLIAGMMILAFGLVIASISAFAAIWGLMRVLERFSAWPFVIYRFVLGVFLIVCVVTGLLPN